jgi:hypothetical protein
VRSHSTGRSTCQDDQAEESRTRGVEREPKVHAKKQGAPHVKHVTGKICTTKVVKCVPKAGGTRGVGLPASKGVTKAEQE